MPRKSLLSFSNWSLRVKATILVILPILFFLISLSVADNLNERKIFQDQLELSSIQMGDILLESLRHAMLHNDQAMMRSTLQDIAGSGTIKNALIIDLTAKVIISSDPTEEGVQKQPLAWGCQECHQYPADQRPRVMRNTTVGSDNIRISTPIKNQPECWNCHSADQTHLGVLLIDSSMAEVDQRLQKNLFTNLILSIFLSLLVGTATYFVMNKMLVNRIEKLHRILIGYSGGDFSVRVTEEDSRFDEVASLGKTFNQMADKLEENKAEIEERSRVREVAVIEERERIARELHDGIAQFLGYVITKVQATRLFLEKGNSKKVDEYLFQIEDETRKQSIDVRASILGLKIFSAKEHQLASDIREGLEQSNRFMDLEINLNLDPRLKDLSLDPEIELQLIRIVREAVSNVRKHSQAKNANVNLELLEPNAIKISIVDDGVGFDPGMVGEKGQPHFGLATMKERAESIGAIFEIKTGPKEGTTISVTLKLPEKNS